MIRLQVFILAIVVVRGQQQLTGQFWHVTDFHWDTNYTNAGGDVTSMCWYNSALPPDVSTGYYGNYACDSPWTLVQSTLNFMAQKLPKPDFIIWTGDDDSHVSNDYFSQAKVIEIINNITQTIKDHFPTTPVIPVFGNHDAYPKHNLPPKPSTLYLAVGQLWKDWLTGPDSLSTFSKGGYYSMPHPTLPNVTVVGLNTPLYYNKNALVTSDDDDPAGQFAWLDNVLRNAANKNQKAYIVSHVPPGVFGRKVTPDGYQWFRPKFNQRYLELIQKHAPTIIGQFYGHDHTDSFKLYYDNAGVPVNAHFAAPAVTPWNTTLSGIGPNNPGVRLFTYDTSCGRPLNYEQYYLNLSRANTAGNDQWLKEYDFLSAYDLPDLSYASLDRLAQTFNTSDRTYFDRYFLYNSVSAAGPEECDAVCERNHYCAIVYVDYDAFVYCNTGQEPVDRLIQPVYPDDGAIHRKRWSVGRPYRYWMRGSQQ